MHRCGLDRDDIHAVHHARFDAVGGSFGADVGLGFRPLQRGAHGVAVVFADKQNRKLPQGGKVHGFVELAFGHRAFTEETGRDRAVTPHVIGQRQACRQGKPAAHNGIAAIEIRRGVEEVH